MERSYGFTVEAGTIVVFQNRDFFDKVKTVNPDLELITIIENGDLKDFKEIVITQCKPEDKMEVFSTSR